MADAKHRAIIYLRAEVLECGPDGEPNGEQPKHQHAEIITIERDSLPDAVMALDKAIALAKE